MSKVEPNSILYWKLRFDIITNLFNNGFESVVLTILEQLNVIDLKCCLLVSKSWYRILERHWDHHELNRVGRGWTNDFPFMSQIQCERKRAICTVSSLCIDESNLVVALASCGKIEYWNRINLQKVWSVLAHDEGVYAVDMDKRIVVSGGDEEIVKIWNRSNGDLVQTLEYHTYMVWNVKIWLNTLFTCSYDCSIAFFDISDLKAIKHSQTIQGPFSWSDALCISNRGQYLCTHDEEAHDIIVWKVKDQSQIVLKGHSKDVNCIKFAGENFALLASAGDDLEVRLWNRENGNCLQVLTQHLDKVWSVDFDRNRLVIGGRSGKIMIWSLDDVLESDSAEGRMLKIHDNDTAVGMVKLVDRAMLVSADGMGKVVMSDFWKISK